MYLNDMEAAKLLCQSGELQSRASEYAILAKQGMMQYWFSMNMVRTSTGTIEENGVEANSELKDTEYTEVKDHMASSLGKPVTKRKLPAKEPESAEKRRRREVQTQKSISMRKCKTLVDKAMNDILGLEGNLPKLVAKGYPETMMVWCQEKIEGMRQDISKAQAVYNEEVVKVSTDAESVESIETTAKKIDNACVELDTAYSSWKKHSGAEVRKLIG